MTNQSWLPRYSRLFSLGLFLNASIFPSVQVSDGFPHLRSIASATAQTIAQGCTTTQINQYIVAFKDEWRRGIAASNLVTYCGPSASPALTKVLQSDPDPGVREMAARTMGHIGGQHIIKPLMTALQSDPSTYVRKTSADALGHIRAETATRLLISVLENPHEEIYVREAAAEALGVIGNQASMDALLKMLSNREAPLNLRSSSSQALKQIGDSVIPSLKTKLQSPDLQTRYWAVVTLAAIDSTTSTQVLESNQTRVQKILEDAHKANIVEFERASAEYVRRGITTPPPRRPLLCKLIPWLSDNWSKCE